MDVPARLPAMRAANCTNGAIRFLAVDTVEEAKSGHPGLPLDAAPMVYVRWTRLLRHNLRTHLGDMAVLAENGRRVLRVHLGRDVAAGLTSLRELVKGALA
jgi:hypothetical protein